MIKVDVISGFLGAGKTTLIKKLFKVIVCLCPGLEITLNDTKYYSKNGLNDLVDEAVGNSEILKDRQHRDNKSSRSSARGKPLLRGSNRRRGASPRRG